MLAQRQKLSRSRLAVGIATEAIMAVGSCGVL
jgi:hypothetical protein